MKKFLHSLDSSFWAIIKTVATFCAHIRINYELILFFSDGSHRTVLRTGATFNTG